MHYRDMDDLGKLCYDVECNQDYCDVSVTGSRAPRGYGKRLGQALNNSMHIGYRNLTLDLLASLVNGDDDADDEVERYDSESIDGIIRFITDSYALRSVSFPRGSRCYLAPCLEAVAKNPRISEFNIGTECPFRWHEEAPVPVQPLVDWLTTTSALENITMSMGLADHVEVANALGKNASLVELSVHHIDKTCQGNFLYAIGTRVSTTLKTLNLEGCYPCVPNKNVIQALSWLVSLSSTSIQTVALSLFKIEPDFLTFLEALSNGRHQVTSLKLKACVSKSATATRILQGVQKCSTQKPDKAVMNTKLREIDISTCHFYHDIFSDPLNVEMVTAIMLSAQFTLERFTLKWGQVQDPPVDLSLVWSTIASQIMHKADPKRDDTDTTPPSFRRLRFIYLPEFQTANNDAMFDCIPKLVSLETLHFGRPYRQVHPYRTVAEPDYSQEAPRLAKAICSNGSLTSVVFDWMEEFPPFWTSNGQQARMVQAALERNKRLPLLLSLTNPKEPEQELEVSIDDASYDLDMDSEASELPPPPAIDDNDDQSRVDKLALFPDLFAAALAPKDMTPNFVLMGLTTLGDDYATTD